MVEYMIVCLEGDHLPKVVYTDIDLFIEHCLKEHRNLLKVHCEVVWRED